MNDERRTPGELLERINTEFHFTLDDAATNENPLVARYWTRAGNALNHDWSG